MEAENITFPKNLMPKKFYIIHTVKRECEELFCSSNSATTSEQHHVGIHLAINVAKTSHLTIVNHGDTQVLAQVIDVVCFAKVLDAVGNNNETSLLRRTDWSSSWRAVIKLENTTAVPGKEQTCTWFGVCHAKFVLLKSEQEIAKNFTITLPRMQL